MSAISNLFGYLLNWLYQLFNNYGLAIIIFSIIFRVVLIPITIKQQRTMKKSAEIQGKVKEIQKKYKNNPEKLNQETIALYKKEKMSPFSGCLSSIVQIIIILAVFYLVSRPLTYMKKIDKEVIENYKNEIQTEQGSISPYYEIEIIQKKAELDPNVNINMNFLGLDLSKVPNQNLKDFTVYIIPLLYVVTSFISIKLTNNMQQMNKQKEEEAKLIEEKAAEEIKEEDVSKENEDKKENQEEVLESMQDMTKSMSYMMPMMAIMIAFIAPLGLALYWLVSNSLMIIERVIINKFTKEKEEQN